ncbi:helix-turn-helix domain-containing protein [Brevundimonas sp.]|jgi:hypothetical protein|uniref:helix-turn-helix domain-containing protein n=1 Tax=Brevundimonas sp. TaxID=1871086 RepID=UPI00116055B1|nr:helix-turn-helix domain-containing protein [Brevundimonas sp.]
MHFRPAANDVLVAEDLAFVQWFGVSAGRARVLSMLWRAQGEIVSASCFGLSRRSVYVYVSELRTALDPGAIRTRSKSGYALTQSGLNECRAALGAMHRWWSAAESRSIAA